jgi:hypothetical protein
MMEYMPYIILAFGAIVILYLALMILRELLSQSDEFEPEETSDERESEADGSLPAEDSPPEESGAPESEAERLRRIENELKDREQKRKAEKIRELEERENIICQREREVHHPIERPPTQELETEKIRVQDLIRRAEESYFMGDIEEANYKRIMEDYQRQLLDLDIKIGHTKRSHSQ